VDSGLLHRGPVVDWSKLPDLAAVAALTCAFASVARRGQTTASRHWLSGWVLIAVHFAALIFSPLPGFWGMVASDISMIALISAGVLFMWASVPYRAESSSLWMLIAVLSTNAAYIVIVGFDHPWPWALTSAAVAFGAAPLMIALTARRDFTHLLRWLLVGLYCILAVFLLTVQNRPGNGLTLASNGVLFIVYIGCCLHVWYSYRGRGTAGSLITIAGFLGWASVFVTRPLIGLIAPHGQIESEVWNLPKYVVAVGMILLLLEDQIEHNKYLALHDELTGLPNRRLFLDRLAISLERARRMESKAAVLVIDLNHFKQVNDTLGHHTGDLLLKKVSSLFLSRVRRSDTVARTGGDEFSLILEEPTNRSNAKSVAKSLMEMMNEPIQVGEHTMRMGASIGVAVFPDDAADMEALCIAADLRMYDDKNESREGTGERISVRSEPLPELHSKENEGFKMIARTPKI
jgi:diguanylate cyclase (GGDEF)-like protein